MRTFLTIAITATVIFTTSCGIVSASTNTGVSATTNTTGITSNADTNVANTTTGTNAGTALLALYNQYKADGKLDLKNINNIVNLATLASNCQGLKSSTADTGSFLTGLINGTKKLVNSENGQTVISSLKEIATANLSTIKTAAAKYAASKLLKSVGVSENAASSAVNSVNTESAGVTTAINSLSTIFNTFVK